MQHLIQQIIYTSHGAELLGAKRTLKEFPNPRDRVKFISSFCFQHDDLIVQKVFDFARQSFLDIYELRNILAHELWASSDEHPDAVLFSSLDENARLLLASGRLWHKDESTPQEIFDATVRFICNVKVVSRDQLRLAVHDAEVCNWCLLHINTVLTETDLQRREEARQAFLIFRGTSHLFAGTPALSGPVEFSATRAKTIRGAE